MGELWRSQPMELVQMIIQFDAVHDTVDELGKLGLVQFRDQNPEANSFQRHFVNEVKRFDELERKVRFLDEQVCKARTQARELGDFSYDSIEIISEDESKPTTKAMIDDIEAKLDEFEKDILQMNTNKENLDRSYNELTELKYVLEKDAFFFNESDISNALVDETKLGGRDPLLDEEKSPLVTEGRIKGNLGFLTGVLPKEKLLTFERVLWRATRGNMFIKQIEIDIPIIDPTTGEATEKNVFIIFFQGEKAQTKIKKTCEAFGANIYNIPDSVAQRAEMRNQVETRLRDLNEIIRQTQEHRKAALLKVASSIELWKVQVTKEKGIYHIMNLFDFDTGRTTLIIDGWAPVTAREDIQAALRRGVERSGTSVPSIFNVLKTKDTPPTYYKTNKFTAAFQGLIESYGVARYMEVNPAPLSIVTFPFLFGVMFGDFGHGFFMSLVAFLFIWFEDRLAKVDLGDMVKILYEGRYLIFMMGLFGMYAGLMYNETFAIPFSLFKSPWSYSNPNATIPNFDPNAAPYLFGVDPNWKNASNDLTFYNSLKMKMSIVLGVTHMVVGICFSAFNAIHFKKPLNFFFEFIPQVVFMVSIFGYMCFLIIYKWTLDWRSRCPESETESCTQPAPALLNLLINMFKSPTGTEYAFYDEQLTIQIVLLLMAVISVPVMLLVKPIILCVRARGHQHHGEGEYHEMEEADDEHGDLGEMFVHQIIHTIEFVLGAISNTASYLRLWALSLAHAELSAVFLDMILIENCFAQTKLNPVLQTLLIFVGWSIWAAATVGVLLLMESLSAFLHALRLHWVEFMNKFYLGDGYKFKPFSYASLLHPEDD